MNFKSTFLLLLLFGLFSLDKTTAQITSLTNFVDGFIVSLKGDTVEGQIDYYQWDNNPSQIRFRTDNQGDGKQYGVKDILGFGLLSPIREQYSRAIVDYNNESLDGNLLPICKDIRLINQTPNIKRDTVFLWILAKGAMNIFELKNRQMNRLQYFIQKNKGKIEELVVRRIRILNTNRNDILEVSTYRNQLATLLADCSRMGKNTGNLPYSRRDFTNLIEKYNRCVGNSTYVKAKEKLEHSFSLMVGLSMPELTLKDNYHQRVTSPISGNIVNSVHIKGQIAPAIGMNYELRLPHYFHFGTEANLTSYRIKNSEDNSYSGFTRNAAIDVNMINTRLNAYGLYFYTTANRIKPFIKLGMGASYYLKNNFTEIITEKSVGTPPRVDVITLNPALSKVEISTLISLGFKSRHLSIEGRYEFSLTNVLIDKGAQYHYRYDDVFKVSRFSLWAGYAF